MNQSLSQLVSECFDKVAHVILQNRIITNDVDNGKMNHWFNLEHRQRPDIVQKLSRWRDEPTLPLFIEILFDEGDGSLPVLLERWSFAFIYDVRDVHRQIEVPSVYKKTIILMRALYSKALRLPTHRLHKQLCKHRLSRSRLVANVKTAPTGGVRFHAPSAAYAFGDVWSGGGCLRLSVEYRRELAALAPRPPPTEPLLISDYAGATAAAQQQQQPAHAGPALLGSLGQPRTALTGRSAPTPTHTHNSPGLALAGTTAQRSGTSDSPHSTFLVGSYPYASSPPLAPGADMFALGTSPVDSSDGASPQLLRRVSPRDPAAPSLVLSLVPTHDDVVASDDSSGSGSRGGGASDSESFEQDMYALEMLADSYSPFAAPVDDASRSQATSGSAMTDGSDADARAVAVHQFTAQCAAPPTLRMFVSRRAEHRQDYYAQSFDELRAWFQAQGIS